MSRLTRDAGKRGLRRIFEGAQHLGVDILPRHYYSQVPGIAGLRRDTAWRTAHSMMGVPGADVDHQVAFVRDLCADNDRLTSSNGVWQRANVANGAIGFGPIEAVVLYCFAALRKPRVVVQVGAGVSTAVLLEAKRRFELELEIVCVDPYPTGYLRELARTGEIDLREEAAQTISLDLLTALAPGNMLFVDSTHAVRPGSEVNRIVLEVLPRLAPGVWVHFHDVVWPFDHSPHLLTDDLFFWSETVLLHAFLLNNDRYELRLALSMLHNLRPEALREAIPSYQPMSVVDGLIVHEGHYPSSAYMQVVR